MKDEFTFSKMVISDYHKILSLWKQTEEILLTIGDTKESLKNYHKRKDSKTITQSER